MLDIMTSPGAIGSLKIGSAGIKGLGKDALEEATKQGAKKLVRDAAGVGIGGGLYEGGLS